jgi:prepilin-type N-terminal cleavage/methylation domain-containing protein
MKKGFSLAELISVLLIIGIILALSIKGADIIDGARLRSDVSSLRNFEAGFSAFYLKNNSFSDDSGNVFGWSYSNGDPILVIDQLIGSRVVNKLDLPIKSYANPKQWSFSALTYEDGNTQTFAIYSNILAGFDNNRFVSEIGSNRYSIGAFGMLSLKLICHVEWVLDDISLAGGSGRLVDGTGNPVPADFPDISTCDNTSKEDFQPYLYLVFSNGGIRTIPIP